MSAPSHMCFYSKRCKFSAMFLEELAKTPFSREFRFVCVDPDASGRRPALPPYVKAVPTLMIKGEDSPRTDNNVMNWLSERRLTAAPARGGGGGGGVGMDDGPMGMGGDLCGIGDEGWAYIDEDTSNAQGQKVRLTSGMVSLDTLHMTMAADVKPTGAMMAAAAPSAAAGNTRQNAKAKAFEDALAAYASSRDADLGPRGPPGR
jgi:hypothetical protein